MSCKVKVISERTVCLCLCREQWCAPQLTQLVRDAGTCGRAATVPGIVCFVFHVCGRDHTMCVFSALCSAAGGAGGGGGQTCSSHQLPPVTSAPGPALHKHNSDRLQACTNTNTSKNTNNNTTTKMETNKRMHTTTNTCTTNASASSGHEEAKTQQPQTKAHICKSFSSVQVSDLVQPFKRWKKAS